MHVHVTKLNACLTNYWSLLVIIIKCRQHLTVRTFSRSVVSRGAGLEVASGRVPAPPPCVWSGGAKWGQSRLCVCVCGRMWRGEVIYH